MGLISQLFRVVKKILRPLFDKLFGRFRRKPAEGETEIPASWVEKPQGPMQKTSEPMGSHPGSLVVNPRKKYRIKWLLSFKRILAGLLMCFNFVLAEFILSTQSSSFAIFFLVFLANAFILADYLWKTRSREVQK